MLLCPMQVFMVRPRQQRRCPAAGRPAVQGADPAAAQAADLPNQVGRILALAKAARAVDQAKAPDH